MLNWIKKLCWKWHYFTGGHLFPSAYLMSKCTIEAPRKLFKSSKVPRRNLTEAEIMFGRADEDVDIGDIGLGLYNINSILKK